MNNFKKILKTKEYYIIFIFLIFFTIFACEKSYKFLFPKKINIPIVVQRLNDSNLGDISGVGKIEQTFISKDDSFSQINVMFGTYSRENNGNITFMLENNDTKEIIDKQIIKKKDIKDINYYQFKIPKVNNINNNEFKITIELNNQNKEDSVTIFNSSFNSYEDGKLYIDGEEKNSDIAFEVVNEDSKAILSSMQYTILTIIFIGIFACISCIIIKFKYKPEKSFLCTALFIGIIFVVIMPPFDNLDEQEHFYRAFEVSEGNFINKNYPEGFGNKIPKSLIETVSNTRTISRDGYKYFDFKKALDIELNSNERVVFRNTASSYFPSAYIPQVIGIWFGKILNVSPIIMMYLARLFNLVSYIIICYYSIKIIPFKKELMYVITLLPMTLFQASTVSADGLTNGCAFLFISYILYLAYGEKDKITRKETIYSLLLATAVSLTKLVYFPISLMFLIIHKNKFKNNKTYYKSALFVILGAIFILGLWSILSASNLKIPDLRMNPNVSPKQQIKYILFNPFEYLMVIINTITIAGRDQILALLGRNISLYCINIPFSIINTYAVILLFFSVVSSEEENKYLISFKERIIYIFIFITTFILIYTALYIGATNVGAGSIIGIQGRYFVPIVPILLLVFMSNNVINKHKNTRVYLFLTINWLLFYGIFTIIDFFN